MDIKKLEEKIDAIPSVCAEGKKAIKAVFEAALGVEFKGVVPDNFTVRSGSRIQINNSSEYLVAQRAAAIYV